MDCVELMRYFFGKVMYIDNIRSFLRNKLTFDFYLKLYLIGACRKLVEIFFVARLLIRSIKKLVLERWSYR